MAFGIKVDLSELEAEMKRLNGSMPAAVEAGMDRCAQVVYNAKQKQIGKTYARKIPTSKRGRQKWDRTGNWENGQDIQAPNQHTRVITTTGPAAKYEGYVAALRTGPDGINRSNPAATEAAKIVEPQLAEAFDEPFSKVLKVKK